MYEAELELAAAVADRAAAIALPLFRGDANVRIKADGTPVTDADLRIEAMAREEIARRFPRDMVLGEEQGAFGTGERVWIIDPIDGTKNFAAGIQIWATLIALSIAGELTTAVVSAPALGERYVATRGGGAHLNGERIHVSQVTAVETALILYSGPRALLAGPHREGLLDVVRRAARTRDVGDFWAHMLVARGAADVALEPSLRTWDVAAPRLIVEESGGRVTSLSGDAFTDGGSVLTTNGVLHDAMQRTFGAR